MSNVLVFAMSLRIHLEPRGSLVFAEGLGNQSQVLLFGYGVNCAYDVARANSRMLRILRHEYSLVEPC